MVTSEIIPEVEIEKKITFPCLMELRVAKENGKNHVVLFENSRSGTVVYSNMDANWSEFAKHSDFFSSCDSEAWVPFKGSIVIKNV